MLAVFLILVYIDLCTSDIPFALYLFLLIAYCQFNPREVACVGPPVQRRQHLLVRSTQLEKLYCVVLTQLTQRLVLTLKRKWNGI